MKYIRLIITYLADILLPKPAEVKELEKLGPTGLIENLKRSTDARTIFDYQDQKCRQAIWEIKFRGNQKLIEDFSTILYDHIIEEIGELRIFNNFSEIILVPIPSSRSTLRDRGFNQCLLICQELIRIDRASGQNNFQLPKNFLQKKVNTARQSKTTSRADRLHNLKNTFFVTPSSLQAERSNPPLFILIDDVITTGATMSEAVRALRDAGAENILTFALAH